MCAPFVPADSVPGQVTLGCGGVARNIAHNLRLMGHEVRLLSVLGSDVFGKICYEQCVELGLDMSLAERADDTRNGLYLCVNDCDGEMVTAVADMDIVDCITPKFLVQRVEAINWSSVVVADTNISATSLQWLIDHCTVPLVVDTVSTAKASRIVIAMQQSITRQLHTLKLNRHEALAVTGCGTLEGAGEWLKRLGVNHVYITLGSEGVYYTDRVSHEHLPAIPTQVVNTTGAGDAFVAGLVHGMFFDMTMSECAMLGLRAAHAALLTRETVNPDTHLIIKQRLKTNE